MKLLILCLAILGVATASAVPATKVHSRSASDLIDDLKDFLALVDVDKCREILVRYLAEDAEVQAAIEWVKSDEFKSLVSAIKETPEYSKVVAYLEEWGVDWSGIVQKVRDWWSSWNTSRAIPVSRNTGGIAGLLKELKDCLPLDEIKALFYEKLEKSASFKTAFDKATSEEARELYQKLAANEKWISAKDRLLKYGVDINAWVDWCKTLLGWN